MVVATNFLDTNVLIYAVSDDRRASQAQALLYLPFVVSVQTLNEFANAARKTLKMPWSDIAVAVKAIVGVSSSIVPISEQTTLAALELAQRYNFSFYDATMVAAAVDAGCSRYYSEDLHHGLLVEKRMTIVNPFR